MTWLVVLLLNIGRSWHLVTAKAVIRDGDRYTRLLVRDIAVNRRCYGLRDTTEMAAALICYHIILS